MIALLSYSINLLASEHDTIPSTGRQDSVLIAYDDLRKVNGKLIELEYEKDINNNLKNIIHNDSIAIDALSSKIIGMERKHNKEIKQVRNQRNIAGGVGIIAIVLLIISIL